MAPRYVWFDYPVHYADETGLLADLMADGEKHTKQPVVEKQREYNTEKATQARIIAAEENRAARKRDLENAIAMACAGEPVTVKDLCDYMDAKPNTVRKWIREYGFWIDKNKGFVRKRESNEEDSVEEDEETMDQLEAKVHEEMDKTDDLQA